jgi:beta-glucosidase-like glycosyl hydrolase
MKSAGILLALASAHGTAVPDTAPPCVNEPATGAWAWCDTSLDIDTRVAALVGNLTNDEKADLLVNAAGAVPRLGLSAYNWWSEALHGVARDGVATSWPQIIGVASSFNTSLFGLLGGLTGTEARGMNNALEGGLYQGLTLWAPNVNIFRDPRWGRGQETPGEDPTLNGEYAEHYVRGLQGADLSADASGGFLLTSACLKHYAAYSEETGRDSFAAVVTAQDMEDTYLPAFERGVEKGAASCIMCRSDECCDSLAPASSSSSSSSDFSLLLSLSSPPSSLLLLSPPPPLSSTGAR